ncbi:CBS domain-containing protein [Marinobacter sp. HL-58]|uniref:CBS domain-containing protein n=1 Tax=Marinobacter sp. HL-58 TaxID=1479237 RepID=UPI00068A1BD6|nr:CBS domain-containing protein [Marinobacter sp. HL-58]KPP98890.1 MAG: CBS domain protein [Marinobacter sp. HL-58]
MLVKDAMISEVVSCTPESSLQEIATLMWDNDCGAVPITDDEQRPVGIVTDRDIAMAAALEHKPLWDIRAEQVSNGKEVFCCGPDDDIQEALGVMEQHEVRRLMVTNQYGQLAGILTMGDILSFAQATPSRSKKAGNSQINASDVMGFLKHVSGHHEPHKAMLAG